MKAKIKPFNILKVRKTKQGIFFVPRYDFKELYLKKRKK